VLVKVFEDYELFLLLLSRSDGVSTSAGFSYIIFFVSGIFFLNELTELLAVLIGVLSTELN
jgi:hypothetical protein